VLLNSDEPGNIFEGAGILQAMTNQNEDPIIEAVAKNNTIDRLCTLLSTYIGNQQIIERCVMTLGNLSTSNNHEIIDDIVSSGFLDRIYTLMHSMTSVNLVKDYMWAISNLVADNEKVATLVLNNTNIV
jgi:hypothetical protein